MLTALIKMSFLHILVLLITVNKCYSTKGDNKIVEKLEDITRIKRQLNTLPLIYPYGGNNKFIIGMGLPIHNEEKIGLSFAANFQYQYVQFNNISLLSQYYAIKTVSREERSVELQKRKDERLVFYKALEEMLYVKGFKGSDCVLSAICEAAQAPVEDEGLFGELLHVLLTPNYGRSPFEEDDEWFVTMSEYIDAHTAGRQMFNCHSIYTGCPQSHRIMDLISILRYE